MLKQYYAVTKPGIIRGNLITAAAGFFLASRAEVDWLLLTATLAGLALIIASACVFNNYLDRDIDAKMARTKKRALVTGKISPKTALAYASGLEILGALILARFSTNWALYAALAGFLFYVLVYGVSKRSTAWATVIGSVPGATPPVVGYSAVTDRLDGEALLLFLILILWQIPHFYAIAIFRMKEYAAAKVPVLPIKIGVAATKRQILAFVALFTMAALSLALLDYTGPFYAAGIALVGGLWLWHGFFSYRSTDDIKWARGMFNTSLVVISAWSLLIILDSWLS